MSTGLVTLTTDFGTRDGYAGSLRGVLLSHDRTLVIADITHDIAPYAVLEGALTLRAAASTFPPGTVHLAVVDPGVGGPRRPLVVTTADAHFVGPDNGLFTPFLDGARTTAIDPVRVGVMALSPTFHGRDLFAVVAARLATGAAPETFGMPIKDPVRLEWPAPRRVAGGWRGVILHVDRFGNAVSNLPGTAIGSPSGAGAVTFRIAGREGIPLRMTYADAEAGTLVALIGSRGLIEVARVEGDAARHLGIRPGQPIELLHGN